MRISSLVAAAKIAIGVMFLMASSVATAEPRQEALQVLQKWTEAFTGSDVDGIVNLYAPDALFVGTGSKTVVTNSKGIRNYFENALLNNRPRSATLTSSELMMLSDTAVLVTGLDSVTGVREGKPFNATGRVTFVVAKRGSEWKIVHFHRSAMPN